MRSLRQSCPARRSPMPSQPSPQSPTTPTSCCPVFHNGFPIGPARNSLCGSRLPFQIASMFMEERHMSDDTNLPEHDPSRRDFHRLTLAAIGGLMAGLARPEQLVQAEQPKQKGDAKPKKPAKEMKEIHVCRGLNSCKGQGIDWDFDGDGKLDVNACAGQGACATAKH